MTNIFSTLQISSTYLTKSKVHNDLKAVFPLDFSLLSWTDGSFGDYAVDFTTELSTIRPTIAIGADTFTREP